MPEALELAESVPQVWFMQPGPETVQLTPAFCESFCTTAVKFCAPWTFTVAEAGETPTVNGIGIPGAGETVMLAEVDFCGSVTETAVI